MYCVVIDKELAVNRCPLKPGTCVWQHVVTNKCMYKKMDNPTPNDIAALTGREPISIEEETELKAKLLLAIKKEIL